MANPHKLPLPKMYLNCIDGIKRVDKDGALYYLDYKPNYYFLEGFVNMLAKPACTTFSCTTPDGDHLFARNYDFVHFKFNDRKNDMTSLNIMVHVKKTLFRYDSLSMCDGFWLDLGKGRLFAGTLDDGKTDISALALIPYLCMDGMNEKGLAVSIMHLPTHNEWTLQDEYIDPSTLTEEEKRIAIILDKKGEVPQKFDYKVKPKSLAINTADKLTWTVNKEFATLQKVKGRKTMFHPVLMRRMLDFCKNVDEAVKLAKKVNVMSPLRTDDYHIMISDKTGKTVILEWIDNVLNVKEVKHGSNYYLIRDDHYGYGEDRDEVVKKELDKNNGVLSFDDTSKLLEDVSQDYRINKFRGYTLWTSLYNLDKLTVRVWQNLDYKNYYDFKLGVNK